MITNYSILSKKVTDYEAFLTFRSTLNHTKEKLVLVNGTFDLLHYGHALLLNEASKYGDCLLVLINSDESIRRLKGESRPLVNLENRIYMLASLLCVDFILPFSEDTVTKYLKEIVPDVWIKGSDYSMKTIEKSEREAAFEMDIKIEILPTKVASSSDLINRLKNEN